MERVLAILDDEEGYIARLLSYFRGQERFREIQVAVFTNEENYSRYVQGHKVGLLLCEERIYRGLEQKPEGKTILLSGRGCVREASDLQILFKFQPAQEIFDEIIRYFDQLEEAAEPAKSSGGTGTTVICAAEGGSGVTYTAFGVARQRAKKHNILYLSLDPFDIPEGIGEMSAGLSEAIYLIKANSKQFQQKLPGMIRKKEHVDCLCGVGHWSDLSECSAAEIHLLLKELRAGQRYDEIIVDAGEWTDAAVGCMEEAGAVIMLVKQLHAPSGKEKELMRQATLRMPDFANKLLRVESTQKAESEIIRQVFEGEG